MNLFYSNDNNFPITVIDSSGLTSGYYSHYFTEQTGTSKKFPENFDTVDTEQQVITGFVVSDSRIHDTRHAEKLLRQFHKIRKPDCYVMDKGYDSEAIHRLIRKASRKSCYPYPEITTLSEVLPVTKWLDYSMILLPMTTTRGK